MAININKKEGDKLRAEEWNELAQEVMGKQPRLNIVDDLDSDSSVDVLSAKQGKVLDEKINNATSTIEGISEKVSKLPTGYYYGQFDSVSGLPDASQLTQKGYAYVASEDPSIYYIYLFDGEGSAWEDSGNKFVTTALEDDLSTKSESKAPTTKVVAEGIEAVDLTKAKTASTELTSTQKYNANANISNRIADVEDVTGVVKALGYRVLNPNLSFAEQVTSANNIYEIREQFDLGSEEDLSIDGSAVINGVSYYYSSNIVLGANKAIAFSDDIIVLDTNNNVLESRKNIYENGSSTKIIKLASTTNGLITYIKLGSVTLEANCTLKFNGGSIINAIITGNNTTIDAPLVRIFNENTILKGAYGWNNKNIYPEWFCSNQEDYSNAIQRCVEFIAGFNIGYGQGTAFGKCVLQNRKDYLISKSIIVSSNRAGTIGGLNTERHIPDYCPNILISSDNPVFKIIGENTSYLIIEDVRVGSQSSGRLSCPAIDITSISYATFRGVSFTRALVGIGIGFRTASIKTVTNVTFSDINVAQPHDVSIPIYIRTTSYFSNVQFKDMHFSFTRLAGVYLRYSTTTGVCCFENCIFDHCGGNYDISEYETYGSFAIKLETSSYDKSVGFIVRNCYFETDFAHVSPKSISLSNTVTIDNTTYYKSEKISLKDGYKIGVLGSAKLLNSNNEILNPSSTEYLASGDTDVYVANTTNTTQKYNIWNNSKQSATATLYVYPSKLNTPVNNDVFKDNAEIVAYYAAVTIEQCWLSVNFLLCYSYHSNVTFNNNQIYQPGIDVYGTSYGTSNIFQPCIIKADAPQTPIATNVLKVDLSNLQTYDWANSTFKTMESSIDFIKRGSQIFIDTTLIVNAPVLNEYINFKARKYITNNIFIGAVIKGSGMMRSIHSTGLSPSTLIDRTKPINYVLVGDVKEQANRTHVNETISLTDIRAASITTRYYYSPDFAVLELYNCTLILNNIDFRIPVSDKVYLYNSKLIVNGGKITLPTNSNYKNMFITHGDCEVSLSNCEIVGGSATSVLIYPVNGHTVITTNNVTNENNRTLIKDIEEGDTDNRPTTLTTTDKGFKYFDTTLGKPIYWNGYSWVDGNGDFLFDNSGTLEDRLALTPIKGQQFRLTSGESDVYLVYGYYGWLKATDGTPWFDDSGTLNAMYDKYNYTLLTEQPSDWTTKYNTYYKIVNGVYTLLTTAETWTADTYYKKDVNAYKGIQVKLTDTDTELLNKVVKWNGTKYINIVDNVALKAGIPEITFTTENNTTTATIASTSSGKIYYTKDGNDPTSSSTEYSSAITLADGDQVKAICVRDHIDNSAIGFVKVATPVITFSSAGILTITCDTPNAKIYYTTDGNPPSTSSTEYDSSTSVTIAKNVTVKAFAVLIGRVNSDVASKKRS